MKRIGTMVLSCWAALILSGCSSHTELRSRSNEQTTKAPEQKEPVPVQKVSAQPIMQDPVAADARSAETTPEVVEQPIQRSTTDEVLVTEVEDSRPTDDMDPMHSAPPNAQRPNCGIVLATFPNPTGELFIPMDVCEKAVQESVGMCEAVPGCSLYSVVYTGGLGQKNLPATFQPRVWGSGPAVLACGRASSSDASRGYISWHCDETARADALPAFAIIRKQ